MAAKLQDFEVSLDLNGGIAPGAYHLGACEALLGAGWEPKWLVSTSIGAVFAFLAVPGASQRVDCLRSGTKSIWAHKTILVH